MRSELIKRILSSIFLIPVAFFFIIKGSFLFNLFILICFLITVYEWQMMSNKKAYNIFGIIFIIISFYLIYKLRNDFEEGFIYFLFITLICISTDIGGYVIGKIFKGPKLTKISPKKTYSGMIGGYFFSIISVILFKNNIFLIVPIVLNLNIFVFVILISTVSQLGDIIISYFKRKSKIKDTGKIIPGHGGILDRIDGMIFAFPFSYIILKMNIFHYF